VRPPVLWYHLILTAYGFWLPNDPRGSWSDFVASWELYRFGPATTVNDKRSYAHDPHDPAARRAAKAALACPPVRFDAAQRDLVVAGFGLAVAEGGYEVLAGCVGHDHAHLVVARHARRIEQVAQHLKAKATMSLTRARLHPLRACRTPSGATPTTWAGGSWNVFIDDLEHLRSAVAYVNRHPQKEGLAPQRWAFLRPMPQ